jgi:predicted O-linked N-acetylglucosamine transferase (SPINDLY family)
VRFPSRSDVKALLSLGDIYLDTFPFGGVNSLVDPLELGLPVVTWEGEPFRSRMGAALLRTLSLPDLIAGNGADYHAIAVKLATDPAARESAGARVRAQMERSPVFLDPLAASEALGDLIETAYDELAANGRKAFRANPAPVRASAGAKENSASTPVAQARAVLREAPADPAARHVVGRALFAAGRADRAVNYLLAALQGQENNATLWLDLAAALRANGQVNQAIEALEAGLRVDETQLEGWIMLAELAQAVGVTDLAHQAASIAQKLAPDDKRPAAYL